MTARDYRQQLVDALVNGLDSVLFYMPCWIERIKSTRTLPELRPLLRAAGCGTAACIGGHFELLLRETGGYDQDPISTEEQAELLDVPEDDWIKLCHGWPGAAWPTLRPLTTITKDDAIEALERLFATYPLEES